MSSASLHGRVTKLERIDGGRVPSEDEFREARKLLDRHAHATFLPELFGFEADPREVLLMKAAEGDGRIAAARDVERRYRRAKGYPEVTEARIEAHRAYLREIFEEVTDAGDKTKALGK